jgi:cation diffusion facilitator CzcD-associated flavoprotein CzcO
MGMFTIQIENVRNKIVVSHHSEPDIPELPGKDSFQGNIMHSHAYREAKPFKGQRVLVVGAGPSALDIALELSKEAERVIIFCQRNSYFSKKSI